MARTADQIRTEIAKVEAEWTGLDPMAGHFTHGAGRGGKASRSQARSADRRMDRSFTVAHKLNALREELRTAEAREALREKAPMLSKRLADFEEALRTGLLPSGRKITADERAAVKSIIRDLRIQLKRAGVKEAA